MRLANQLPVPAVVDWNPEASTLIVDHVAGTPGQDLIDTGRSRETLRLLGTALKQLQSIETSIVPELPGNGPVIVHGDFGPQNLLVHDGAISALIDWEFAHLGQPVEDAAWAEWIIRMHHPAATDTLPEFFDAREASWSWVDRHASMVQRCRDHLHRAEQLGSSATTELWQQRVNQTEGWVQ